MLKPVRNIYIIKKTPYNDNEKLENLLNEMSKDGWDLYSMQEIENDDDIFYNCIFIKEIENDVDCFDEDNGLLDFKPRIERIINPELDPYDLCLDIMKKIKEKRQKIAQVKSLIDGTSEDSRSVLNDEISRHIDELEELKKKLSKVINPDIMEQKLGETRLTIAISEELAPILDSSNEDNLLSQIVYVRQNLTEKSGYIIPKVKIEIDETLDENEFSIKLRGISVINSFAYTKHTMFINDELNIEKIPENTIKSIDEISGNKTLWIDDEIAKDFWIKGLSACDYITSILEFAVVNYIDDIFDYADINRYIEIVGNQNLYLVENIIPDFLSVSELKFILSSLLKEKVSIKDIVYIFEKINDFADEEDKENLLAKVRIGLSRQISASICNQKDNTIYAFELSEESLDLLGLNDEEIFKINIHKIERIVNKLKNKAKELTPKEKEILLIAPMEVRHMIYLIFSQIMPNIRVFAREELLFEYPLKILAEI